MASDEVGYCKPPRNTRWQAGQSGNPGGRPKERGKSLLALAASILSEPVAAKAPNGGTIRLDGLEAAYMALCRKALKGDDASLFQAIKVMLELIPAGEEKRSERDADYSDAKRRLLAMAGLTEEDLLEV